MPARRREVGKLVDLQVHYAQERADASGGCMGIFGSGSERVGEEVCQS